MLRALLALVCLGSAIYSLGQNTVLPPRPADPMKLALLAANTPDPPKSISFARAQETAGVISLLKVKRNAEAKSNWTGLVKGLVDDNISGMDINMLIQYILKEAFLDTQRDLVDLLAKMDDLNRKKEAIRDYLEEVRKARDNFTRGMQFAFADPGIKVVRRKLVQLPKRLATKTMLEEEIKKWEEKLNGIGDDAQLANVDLQNILQKQQQTLQMMSNISKMLYDTAQSVIRRIGG